MKSQTSSCTYQLQYHYKWITISVYLQVIPLCKQLCTLGWPSDRVAISVCTTAVWDPAWASGTSVKLWNLNITTKFSGKPLNDSCSQWTNALQPLWHCEYRDKHFTPLIAYISTPGGTPSSSSLQFSAHLLLESIFNSLPKMAVQVAKSWGSLLRISVAYTDINQLHVPNDIIFT